MMHRRKYTRVDVNIPISCRFMDDTQSQNIPVIGSVYNLSLGGMKVSMPLPESSINSNSINYFLNLPSPFSKFSGNGKIKWLYQDQENQCLLLGMEFSSLNEKQYRDIECIVNELCDDTVD